jgi:hypothetical protein
MWLSRRGQPSGPKALGLHASVYLSATFKQTQADSVVLDGLVYHIEQCSEANRES